jgi:hypothetical protein
MMTFDAGYLAGAVSAAILGDVIEVAECNLPQLRFLRQDDCLWRLLSILRRHVGGDGPGTRDQKNRQNEGGEYCKNFHG